MSNPSGLSPEAVEAFYRLKGQRDVNTLILHCVPESQTLSFHLEGNLTHDELLQALPPGEACLVVHELSFASREGSRRHETLLILWAPSGADEQDSWTAAYTALKESLTGTCIPVIASQKNQLDYRRLVALVTG